MSSRETDGLREGRAERRPDLNDRPLAADRSARADRQGRGEGFDDRDLAANIASLIEDRVHHLWHAVALGFGREPLHQINDDEAAEDRRQDHPIAEAAWTFEDVGVVCDFEHAIEHEIVNEADERAQEHGADARQDSDAQREKAEREQTDSSLGSVIVEKGLRKGVG